MSDTSLHKCTGQCNVVGFLVEYCTACGWDDGFSGTPEVYEETITEDNLKRSV